MSESDARNGSASLGLDVNELFLSIQGESTFAGLPCVFVRLTGCPLSCAYCDTRYAREEPGVSLGQDAIVARVLEYGVPLVELTGGEPLAQAGTPALLRQLCDLGLTVLLETSGALDLTPVDPRVHVIMDYKCPSSGMTDRMHPGNLDRLGPGDELKLVLSGREDYLFARDLLDKENFFLRVPVLLSPVHGVLSPERLAAWMLEDRLPARLQLQLHKILWPPDRRGV